MHGHVPLMHAPACYTMSSVHLRGYYSDLFPTVLHMHILLFCLTYIWCIQVLLPKYFLFCGFDQSCSNSLTVTSSQIITNAQMILKLALYEVYQGL